MFSLTGISQYLNPMEDMIVLYIDVNNKDTELMIVERKGNTEII